MEQIRQHPPVILLLEKGAAAGCQDIRNWFAHSRFLTSEAGDVFSALEEMSDFTVRDRPDVILLNVDSAAGDINLIRAVVCSAPGDADVPIIVYSETNRSEKDGCFSGNLPQLAERLETLIPDRSAYVH